MPLYAYSCTKCENEYEEALPLSQYDDVTHCPKCNAKGEKIIRLGTTRPTFSEKMFPYYDQALMQRFESPQDRKNYLKQNNLEERSTGHMTKRQEEYLMKFRGRKDLGGFAYED